MTKTGTNISGWKPLFQIKILITLFVRCLQSGTFALLYKATKLILPKLKCFLALISFSVRILIVCLNLCFPMGPRLVTSPIHRDSLNI